MAYGNYLFVGGSRGIGLEIVRQLSAAGHAVVAAARHAGDVEALENEVNYLGADHHPGPLSATALTVWHRATGRYPGKEMAT